MRARETWSTRVVDLRTASVQASQAVSKSEFVLQNYLCLRTIGDLPEWLWGYVQALVHRSSSRFVSSNLTVVILLVDTNERHFVREEKNSFSFTGRGRYLLGGWRPCRTQLR